MIYKKIGQYVHLLLDPLARQKTELEFVYSSGGSWFEKPEDRGKKHLLEHCICSRTKDMDFETFRDYQFAKNIMVNAYTSTLVMGVNLEGHRENAMEMLDKLLEMSLIPTFEQSILDQEKEIVLREISERSGDPSYRLHFQNMAKIFKENSYNRHEVLGSSERVAETSIADFEHLHQQNLAKSHLLILLNGGGFETSAASEKIGDFFDSQNSHEWLKTSLNSDQKDDIDYRSESVFEDFKFLPIVDPLAHEHAEISIYIPTQITFKNRPIQRMFEELFLKYHGVLYDRLRNKEGLIYSMQTNHLDSCQHLLISISSEIRHVQKIVGLVEETFSDFQKVFNVDKFRQIQDIVRKKTEISMDTLSASSDFGINSLFSFGLFEDLESFSKRLREVSETELKSHFETFTENLKNKRLVVVSKNSEIEKLSF